MFTLSEKFGKRSWRLERFYSLMVPYLFDKMKNFFFGNNLIQGKARALKSAKKENLHST